MTEIILTILFPIFVVGFICIDIVTIAISFANKSLLCAKIYTFMFEHDDWKLYKKAKKQGIQHYLNWYHFSRFYDEWNKVKDEYGVNYTSEDDYLKLDEETKNVLDTKFNEVSEKYYYNEFYNADESINDDDIVLSLSTHYGLSISVGNEFKSPLIWEPMVRDILKGREIWANGKTDNIKRLLTDPKEVISF